MAIMAIIIMRDVPLLSKLFAAHSKTNQGVINRVESQAAISSVSLLCSNSLELLPRSEEVSVVSESDP